MYRDKISLSSVTKTKNLLLVLILSELFICVAIMNELTL